MSSNELSSEISFWSALAYFISTNTADARKQRFYPWSRTPVCDKCSNLIKFVAIFERRIRINSENIKILEQKFGYLVCVFLNEVWNRVTYDYLSENLSGFSPLNRIVLEIMQVCSNTENGLNIDANAVMLGSTHRVLDLIKWYKLSLREWYTDWSLVRSFLWRNWANHSCASSNLKLPVFRHYSRAIVILGSHTHQHRSRHLRLEIRASLNY